MLKEILSYPRAQRNGIFILLLLIVLVLVLLQFVPLIIGHETYDNDKFNREVYAFINSPKKPPGGTQNKCRQIKKDTVHNVIAEFFFFDPNILPDEGWLKLGLNSREVKTIRRYIDKGGHFFQNKDLRKIYGINDSVYSALEPYMQIASYPDPVKRMSYKERLIIELNSSDSSALVTLNGIGPAFAARIIKYRNLLGGFVFKEQIMEVYGLDTALYAKISGNIRVDTLNIRKININEATLDDLKAHPYIKWKIANAIINYRTQHGNFYSVEDLKKIMIINEEVLRKMKPYLSVH